MLKLTRKTGIMDVGRLANAVSRPGIDPRTWVSYATVDAIGVDSEGVFVDVELLPTREKMTARLGAMYAGPGYGFNIPIGVNDEVLVGVPNGDPLHGPTVLARMHSPSDELPQDAIDNPTDLVLVVKDGVSLRINVSGGGKVFLGSTNATEQAVLGSTYRSAEDSLFNALSTLVVALGVHVSPFGISPDPTLATACVTFEGAVASFQAAAAAYLSQKVTVG